MKNKEIIVTIISILISINIFAISNYKSGDSLYVWAQKGLQLRLEPSFTSDPIALIEYGEIVMTLEEKLFFHGNHRQGELSVNEINSKTVNGRKYPGLRIKGMWCKVKYMDNVGYLFDGYLSSFKPFDFGESNNKYFDRNFSIIDTIISFNQTGPEWDMVKTIYSNGISYFRSQFTNAGSETIIFPYSIEEAYLIFVNRFVNEDYSNITLVESTNDYLFFSIEFSNIIIRKVNGFIVIEDEWGN